MIMFSRQNMILLLSLGRWLDYSFVLFLFFSCKSLSCGNQIVSKYWWFDDVYQSCNRNLIILSEYICFDWYGRKFELANVQMIYGSRSKKTVANKALSVWLYFYMHMKTEAFKFWNRIVAVERITRIHKSYILFILGNKTARNIKFPRWLESFSIMFRIVLVHCIL